MGRIAKEVVGQVLCFVGFVGIALTCGIPMWRVTTFVGANIVTGQIVWDGLWMNCVMQSTGQMQCSIHQFLLRLARDLQGARALVVSAVVFAALGIGLTFVGAKCTSCLSNASSRAKVVILGGVICIVGGVLCLIPVCWSAAFTITDFQNPATVDAQRRELGRMGANRRQYLGFALAGVGALGAAVICGLPMWKVTAFISANIVTAQVFWEGLWMNCVLQSTGHLQCKAYDSLLALPRDLQAARALVVVSIAVAVVGAFLGIAGGHCTNFLRRDPGLKARVAIGSGVAFIAAGVLCLVPVSWTASTLVTSFFNPLVPTGQKGELGAALYLGWMAGALLVLGGGILVSSCPPRHAPAPAPRREFAYGSHHLPYVTPASRRDMVYGSHQPYVTHDPRRDVYGSHLPYVLRAPDPSWSQRHW
ncbi:claudin-14-like [Conger conger]|uniref:claudin-14-like n=1 Tax=Conger conger TaxID=82655 RepID=UPI002A5A47FF|nr:claudin-14-like [Conger conger]